MLPYKSECASELQFCFNCSFGLWYSPPTVALAIFNVLKLLLFKQIYCSEIGASAQKTYYSKNILNKAMHGDKLWEEEEEENSYQNHSQTLKHW